MTLGNLSSITSSLSHGRDQGPRTTNLTDMVIQQWSKQSLILIILGGCSDPMFVCLFLLEKC
jgi:hypothetical protein